MFTLKQTSFFIAILLLLLPLTGQAETVLRTGESISITTDQKVLGDFYVAAETITMSGLVDGDLYAVGNKVTVDGQIKADFLSISKSTQLHAEVDDDVRVLAGEVIVAGPIKGDLFVISETLKVLSSASIGGDLIFFGGAAEVEGDIAGSVLGSYRSLRLNAPVSGLVDVTVKSNFVLGDRSEVTGDISYTSRQEVIKATNTVVGGETVWTKPIKSDNLVSQLLWSLAIFFFSALVIFFVIGQRSANLIVELVTTNYSWVGLIGLALLLGAPILVVLFGISLVGIPISIIILSGFMALVLMAFLLTPILFGVLLANLLKWSEEVSVLTISIGTVIGGGLLIVPVVGPLIILCVTIIMLGAITLFLFKALRHNNE